MTNPPTIVEALVHAAQRLASAGVEDAALEARLLLRHALGAGTADLYLRSGERLAEAALAAYDALLLRRAGREPLAYILGTAEFYGLELRVTPDVLIPRPETELIVDAALGWLRGAKREDAVAADIGTGSGCLAIALAANAPSVRRLYAIDISPAALRLAEENAERHAVASRITFLHGDLLAPLPEPVDLLVANLPYIPAPDIDSLMPEVRDHEPRVALTGGPDGFDLIRRLLNSATSRLKPDAALFLELGIGQGDAAQALAHARFPHARTHLLPDLAGIPRVLYILPHAP
jgi:release factor glutamine methyltransferase